MKLAAEEQATVRKQEDEKQELDYVEGSKSEVKSTKVQSAATQRWGWLSRMHGRRSLCCSHLHNKFKEKLEAWPLHPFCRGSKRRGLHVTYWRHSKQQSAEEKKQELEEGLKLCEKIVQKSASIGLISKQSADVFVAIPYETCTPYGNGASLKTGEYVFYDLYENIIQISYRSWSGPPKLCADLYTGEIYRPPKYDSCIDR